MCQAQLMYSFKLRVVKIPYQIYALLLAPTRFPRWVCPAEGSHVDYKHHHDDVQNCNIIHSLVYMVLNITA